MEKTVKDKSLCTQVCQSRNCLCPQLYRQKLSGGCEIYQFLTEKKKYNNGLMTKYLYNCSNLVQIDKRLVNDLVPDCPDSTDEMVFLINSSSFRHEYNCPQSNMLECYPGHSKCFTKDQVCLYNIDEATYTVTVCRNGKHLENCEYKACSKSYKCLRSYCIPYQYICDGKWDCWNGEDESVCSARHCTHLFKCSHSSACLPLDLICDKFIDCNHGDDEYICMVCPDMCTCLGYAIQCRYIVIDISFNVLREYLFVDIAFSIFQSFFSLQNVSIALLSQNSISSLWRILTDEQYHHLKLLDIRKNLISKLTNPLKYIKLHLLVSLNFSQNIISKIEDYSFNNFKSVNVLDLSNNKISVLKPGTLNGLIKLKMLNLQRNPLYVVRLATFVNLPLKFVVTEHIQVCCITRTQNANCSYQLQHKFLCGKLLKNSFFIVVSGTQSIFIVFSNIFFLSYYVLCAKHENRGYRRNKFTVSLFILHLFNFIFGFYLGIIITKSILKGELFIEIYQSWKCGWICYSLSAMSLLSILIHSVVTLQISIIRYIAVKYPFKIRVCIVKLESLLLKLILGLLVISCMLTITSKYTQNQCISSPLCNFFGHFNQLLIEKCVTILIATVLIICSLVISLLSYSTFKVQYTCTDGAKNCNKLQNDKMSLAINLSLSSVSYFMTTFPVAVIFLLSVFRQSANYIIVHYYTMLVLYPMYPLSSTFIYSSHVLKQISKSA